MLRGGNCVLRRKSLTYLNPGAWWCHWDSVEVQNRDISGGEQEASRRKRMDEDALGRRFRKSPTGVLHSTTPRGALSPVGFEAANVDAFSLIQ